MKAVIKKKAGKGFLELVEKEIPKINSDQILVKVKIAAICGTDVTIDDWGSWAEKRMVSPVTVGHEFSGEIVQIGLDVKHLEVGQIISAESHVICHHCHQCQKGNYHVCENTKIIGVNYEGAFAEYIAIPAENAVVVNDTISIESAALMEPLGAAVHAVMEFDVRAKTVVVVGCGPIGLMAIPILKKTGAVNIIASETSPERGQKALNMGADYLINPLQENIANRVLELTDGHGAEVVIDFSGNTRGISDAFSYLSKEGQFAILGIPSDSMTFKIGEFVYSGQTMKGIAGRLMYQNWVQMKALLTAGLDIDQVITHKLPLEDFQMGIDMMRRGDCSKVLLIIDPT